MPELPEVETIRRGLTGRIIEKKIIDVWVEPSFKKKISPSAAALSSKLRGAAFQRLQRRAKLLIFELNEDIFLLVHLKMTGQLVYQPDKGKIVGGGHAEKSLTVLPNRFTRVIFYFEDKARLYFNDTRKFGYLKLVDRLKLDKELNQYGVEPLAEKFSFKVFDGILQSRLKQKIKTLLMDQKAIAGMGNIYADEVCFSAGVNPSRRIVGLSEAEKKKIFSQIKKILTEAIKAGGTSVNTYVGASGRQGSFQNQLRVYGRAGEKCRRCGETLQRTKISGRGTVFCPRCQR